MNETKVVPIFKYIGGKSWLRDSLRLEIDLLLTNQATQSYIEPFAGGLGAFLSIYDILLSHKVKKIILNDINVNLISFYQFTNDSPELLIKEYMKIENGFKKTVPNLLGLHKLNDKDKIKLLLANSSLYYKAVKNNFNKIKSNASIQTAAHLLFLQNHSFNGIYRENLSGEYNTPFNWDGKVFTKEKITDRVMAVHNVFKKFKMSFSNDSYDKINYKLSALYYLDPPYLNEVTAQENKYHKVVFGLAEQEKLIKKISKTCFLYSNHNSPILLALFQKHVNNSLHIKKIPRKNLISSSKTSRAIDKMEILISHPVC